MPTRLMELNQRKHDLKEEATALLDAAETETDDAKVAAATAKFDEITDKIAAIDADIATEQAKEDRRSRLAAIRIAEPSATAPVAPEKPEPGASLIPAQVRTAPKVDPMGGFSDIAEFAISVARAATPNSGPLDERLAAMKRPRADAPSNYLEGGGNVGEGFELPAAMRADVWELVFNQDGLLARVDLEPTSARQVQYVADESTPWGSTGVQANWRSESSQMSASKQATSGRTMDLHELYAFVIATEELLEDAPRLASRITRKASQAIAYKIDDAIVNGTGSGQPAGWLNHAAAITIAKESGQAADTLDDQNVLKMYSRLLVAPGDTPFWLANRDIVPQLAGMVIGDTPVWMPPGALISAPGGILLGYPVVWSEHAQTLGDKGDLQLISPRGYYAARRTTGVNFASSMHLFFDYNMQAFRWTFRFGGQPHLSAPVSPANGSSTKSHFVQLAERA